MARRAVALALAAALLLVPPARSGLVYPACYGGCLGTCFTIGAVAMAICAGATGGACAGFAPAAGTSGAAACTSGCAAACVASCLADNVTVLVGAGAGVATPVQAVRPGQRVWTVREGKPVLTEVAFNARYEGSFPLVALQLAEGRERYSLMVTEGHGSPRAAGAGAAWSGDGGAEVVPASWLRPGDALRVLGPRGAAVARVASVERVPASARNVLVTAAGTVLANGVLTTTLCEAPEAGRRRANLTRVLEEWRGQHAFLLA